MTWTPGCAAGELLSLPFLGCKRLLTTRGVVEFTVKFFLFLAFDLFLT